MLLTLFCLSGVALNHRSDIRHIDVSRNIMPDAYRYDKWNNGLMRGTLTYNTSAVYIPGLFIYGNAGIWHCDKGGARCTDFNRGLPEGADERNVRGMVQTPTGKVFAVTPTTLYCHGRHTGWRPTPLRTEKDERLSDVTVSGDTLVAVGRSCLYVSLPPYSTFRRIRLKASGDYDGRATLFQTVWTLHNGKMFGKAGQLFVDLMAVLLMTLSVTAATALFMRSDSRKVLLRNANKRLRSATVMMLHRRLGKTTIILTLFTCVTGWMLRPPLMLLLTSLRTPAMPCTTLHSANPWHDKLRMLRHDDTTGEWLISTSEGFYSMKTLDDTPEKMEHTPPVSLMGLNVWQKNGQGQWLAGSFSGMYVWDRSKNEITDFFTGETVSGTAARPFGQHPTSGYSSDFAGKAFAVDYRKGTDAIRQPAEMSELPMALWAVAQEIHTGRIFTLLGTGSVMYVFVAGGIVAGALCTGARIASRKRRRTDGTRHRTA